jgi:hypothetical protein
MRTKLSMIFAVALAGMTIAQAQTAVPDGLPWPRGVYLRAGSDWVGLPVNPLLPIAVGSSARWLLGFGQSDAIAEMPGPHALVQIGNTKPVFYLRGLPQANGIYLVRSEQKEDYRQVRMPVSRDFRQFTKLRAQDLVELDMRQMSGDVLSATPRTDLKPGEYTIISVFEQNYRPIRASFEFGVSSR